jgi:hypothetical protein
MRTPPLNRRYHADAVYFSDFRDRAMLLDKYAGSQRHLAESFRQTLE